MSTPSSREMQNGLRFVSALSDIFSNLKMYQGRSYLHELLKEVAFSKSYIAEARSFYACQLDVNFNLSAAGTKKRIPVLTLQQSIEAAILKYKLSATAKKGIIMNIYDDGDCLVVKSNVLPDRYYVLKS